ncbi:MAG: hypothetical protein QM660_09020 [Dysgonomonas sp.]
MNDKNKEEKAKQYAMLACGYYAPDCKPEYCNSKCQWFINSNVPPNIRAYEKDYTQAVTDQYDTLTQYKEALREIDKLFNSDCSGMRRGEFEDLMNSRQTALDKAKQLLNN